jgi:hypothetical protein
MEYAGSNRKALALLLCCAPFGQSRRDGGTLTATMLSSYLVGLVAALAAMAVMPRGGRRAQIARLLLLIGLATAFVVLLPLSPLGRVLLGVGATVAILLVAAARELWARLQARPPNGISDFRVDEPQSGAARQAFSTNQAPLVSRGKYYGHVVAVRAMLVDEDGRFYLQHPEVELHDDTSWVATNIRPEAGIDSIAFVAAGKRGKACFDNMVTQNQWRGFDKLPPNTRILESVQIKVS